jgi:hypothetical protein
MTENNLNIEALAAEKTELQLRLLKLNKHPDSMPEKQGEIVKTRKRLQEIEQLIEDWTQQP